MLAAHQILAIRLGELLSLGSVLLSRSATIQRTEQATECGVISVGIMIETRCGYAVVDAKGHTFAAPHVRSGCRDRSKRVYVPVTGHWPPNTP
jgi:hypothetical protein